MSCLRITRWSADTGISAAAIGWAGLSRTGLAPGWLVWACSSHGDGRSLRQRAAKSSQSSGSERKHQHFCLILLPVQVHGWTQNVTRTPQKDPQNPTVRTWIQRGMKSGAIDEICYKVSGCQDRKSPTCSHSDLSKAWGLTAFLAPFQQISILYVS
jgi:hypothetical protein